MRLAILSAIFVTLGCGPSSSPPLESSSDAAHEASGGSGREAGPPEDLVALCNDLSSADLEERVDATRDLLARINRAVTGGTEQQMEAAADLCERETGARPTLGSGDAPTEQEEHEGCFEACVQRRMASGETREDSEGQCMQDCNEGE